MSEIEYERRFLLSKLPTIELGKPEVYEQGFIDNPVGLVVRPRREGEKFYLQIKKRGQNGITLERPKLDLSDSPKIFEDLLKWVAVSPGLPVNKDRYTLAAPDNKGTTELVIDVFHGIGELESKILAEAAFANLEDMKAWTPPPWMTEICATEVTGDARYNNESLSFHGWPS